MQQWFMDMLMWLGLVGLPEPGLVPGDPQWPAPPPGPGDLGPPPGDAGIIIGNGRALDGAAATRDSTGVAITGVRVEQGRLVR